MKPLRVVGLLLFLGFAVTKASAVFLYTATGAPWGNRTGEDLVIGEAFTVGSQALQVTALGFEDVGGDGFAFSHQVGLWDSGMNLLATVTIQAGTASPLANTYWRFETLGSPITLSANTSYVIGGVGVGDMITDADAGGGGAVRFSVDSFVTTTQTRFNVGPGFAFPDQNGFGNLERWAPANMEFTAVPEPSTYAAMLGVLAIGLGAFRRRRRTG